MEKNGISVKDIKKIYNDNVVLDIDYAEFETGNIYGLTGKNGVGKTTLLQVLAGKIRPDSGFVLGNDLTIEMIHHEGGLFQELTVYENIFLNREIYKHKLWVPYIDWKRIKEESQRILNTYSLNLDLSAKVKDLDFSTQKLLEVIIALSKNPDVIIIDEPLTLLDMKQIDYLNSLIDGFVKPDNMVIYSSHRLDEFFRVVNKVVTMRAGKIVSIQEAKESVLNGLLEFSEKDTHKYPKRPIKKGKKILEVHGLKADHIEGIDFSLASGEILGIIGLKGAYKSSIGKALFGAIPSEGLIRVDGVEKRIRSTTQAVKAGICYLGSVNEGMFLDDSVIDNVAAANVPRVRRLNRSAKRLISKYYLQMLNVSQDQMDKSIEKMSAGNKQKVLLAKWFLSKSKVFVFNRPTANIDVPSKVDIYNIFLDLAESGAGIILISNDLEEIAGLCDRVIVIEVGKIKKELYRKDLSVHLLVESLQSW